MAHRRMSAPYVSFTSSNNAAFHHHAENHPSSAASPHNHSPLANGHAEHGSSLSPERIRPRGNSGAHAHHKPVIPPSSNSSQPSMHSRLPSRTSLDTASHPPNNAGSAVSSGARNPSSQALQTRLDAQLGPHHHGSNNSNQLAGAHSVTAESSKSEMMKDGKSFNMQRRPTLRSALLDDREGLLPTSMNSGSAADFPRRRNESVANSILLKAMKQQNFSTSTFGSSGAQFRNLGSMEVTQIDASLLHRSTLNLKHARLRDHYLQWSFQRDREARPVLLYVILTLCAITTVYGAISAGLQQKEWSESDPASTASLCQGDFLCGVYQYSWAIVAFLVILLLPVVRKVYLDAAKFPDRYLYWPIFSTLCSVLLVEFVAFTQFGAGNQSISLHIWAFYLLVISHIGQSAFNVPVYHQLFTTPIYIVEFILWSYYTREAEINLNKSSYTWSVMLASLTLIASWFGRYKQEFGVKEVFLTQAGKNELTNKLREQLANQKQNKTYDFSAPAEKANHLLKHLLLSDNLAPIQSHLISQAITLLQNTNLNTPDVISQINNNPQIDEEGRNWVLSEIASELHPHYESSAHVQHASSPNISEQKPRRASVAAPIGKSGLSHAYSPGVKETPSEQWQLSFHRQPELKQALLTAEEWDFEIFDWSNATNGRPLAFLADHLFTVFNLEAELQIPMQKFQRFAMVIEDGYHAENAYHNAIHAADVLHAVSHLVSRERIKAFATPFDILCLFVGAMIHDHDHPALTNPFLVKTQDPLAILYNDKSVLENHHAATGLTQLMKPENNFLSHFTPENFKAFRELTIDIVLATDLSQHLTLLSAFKQKVAAGLDLNTRDHKVLLWKLIIKCADVSNCAKTLKIYSAWIERLFNEMWNMGDKEKALKVDVSPYSDREQQNLPSSQIGFIDFIVGPLFEMAHEVIDLPVPMVNLTRNKDFFKRCKDLSYMRLDACLHECKLTLAGNETPSPPTADAK